LRPTIAPLGASPNKMHWCVYQSLGYEEIS
jgi:hypothetical protein